MTTIGTALKSAVIDRAGTGIGTPAGMKRWGASVMVVLAVAGRCVGASPALHLESGPDGLTLVVSGISESGMVSIVTASDLPQLGSASTMFFQTNTPFQGELRLPVATSSSSRSQALFQAIQWTGLAPTLVEIPAGTFLMGSPPSEVERQEREGPQTPVTISHAFSMGRFEVTQGQYEAVMGVNPSYYSGNTNRPVERVGWSQATDYCARLTELQRAAGALPNGWVYRLPTEAEWEYACRAGTTSALGLGPDLRSGMANFDGRLEYDSELGTVSNPEGTILNRPNLVGQYPANAWGLHDMHGNLWEWCLDFWSDRLPGIPVTDPTGPAIAGTRVVRGGCFYNPGRSCRSGTRAQTALNYASFEMGFRVVLARVAP